MVFVFLRTVGGKQGVADVTSPTGLNEIANVYGKMMGDVDTSGFRIFLKGDEMKQNVKYEVKNGDAFCAVVSLPVILSDIIQSSMFSHLPSSPQKKLMPEVISRFDCQKEVKAALAEIPPEKISRDETTKSGADFLRGELRSIVINPQFFSQGRDRSGGLSGSREDIDANPYSQFERYAQSDSMNGGEDDLEDEPEMPDIPQPYIDNLAEMGFPADRCRRALLLTHLNVESAADLLLTGDEKLEREPSTSELIRLYGRKHKPMKSQPARFAEPPKYIPPQSSLFSSPHSPPRPDTSFNLNARPFIPSGMRHRNSRDEEPLPAYYPSFMPRSLSHSRPYRPEGEERDGPSDQDGERASLERLGMHPRPLRSHSRNHLPPRPPEPFSSSMSSSEHEIRTVDDDEPEGFSLLRALRSGLRGFIESQEESNSGEGEGEEGEGEGEEGEEGEEDNESESESESESEGDKKPSFFLHDSGFDDEDLF